MPSYTVFLAVSQEITDNKWKLYASNINNEAIIANRENQSNVSVYRCDSN